MVQGNDAVNGSNYGLYSKYPVKSNFEQIVEKHNVRIDGIVQKTIQRNGDNNSNLVIFCKRAKEKYNAAAVEIKGNKDFTPEEKQKHLQLAYNKIFRQEFKTLKNETAKKQVLDMLRTSDLADDNELFDELAGRNEQEALVLGEKQEPYQISQNESELWQKSLNIKKSPSEVAAENDFEQIVQKQKTGELLAAKIKEEKELFRRISNIEMI